MPIYDADDTTRYQIGNLYDADDTTRYQIGKVYDNDGTTNSLIYSAEENVLASGASMYNVRYANNGGSYSCDNNTLSMNAMNIYGWGGGICNCYANIPFDLTGASALSFTVNVNGHEVNRSLYVGVVKTLPTSDGSWCPPGWVHAGANNTMRVVNAKEWSKVNVAKSALPGTYSLDVSNLSGKYYITFCFVNHYESNANLDAGVVFSNVLLV